MRAMHLYLPGKGSFWRAIFSISFHGSARFLKAERRTAFEILQFFPIDWDGHRRAGPGTNGISRDRACGLIVAKIIDENAAFSYILAVVDGEAV